MTCLDCAPSEDQGREEEYLGRVVCPLTIHEELVLMLSFWQVQDGYKVIVAARKKEAEVCSGMACLLSLLTEPVIEQNKTFPSKTKSSATGE